MHRRAAKLSFHRRMQSLMLDPSKVSDYKSVRDKHPQLPSFAAPLLKRKLQEAKRLEKFTYPKGSGDSFIAGLNGKIHTHKIILASDTDFCVYKDCTFAFFRDMQVDGDAKTIMVRHSESCVCGYFSKYRRVWSRHDPLRL